MQNAVRSAFGVAAEMGQEGFYRHRLELTLGILFPQRDITIVTVRTYLVNAENASVQEEMG